MEPLLSGIDYLWVALAALAAGTINALAGGGTLVSFPILVAAGLPPVSANITSTVALWPGYLGATLAQREDLKGQRKRLLMILPVGALGGLIGGILLVNNPDVFPKLVPYLILMASLLLAVGQPLKAWLARRAEETGRKSLPEAWILLPLGLAAIYGGYFGAGLSVITLAVLGLVLNDNLTRLNALKQILSLSVNIVAAIYFVSSGPVQWWAALVMAIGALTGGVLGGKLAGRIPPNVLRWVVVAIGLTVGIVYLIRG